MNSKKPLLFLTIFGLSLAFSSVAHASGLQYAFIGAGRYHAENEYSPVAFEDGDWSFLGGIEIYEGPGYWQFAVDYADGGSGTVSRVITPQINLNFSEGGVIAGVGVLYSYVDDDVTGSDWSDIYYQLNAGLDMPMGDSSSLIAVAHYVFEDWGDVGEFDFDLVDYTVGFNYKF